MRQNIPFAIFAAAIILGSAFILIAMGQASHWGGP